MSEPSVPAWTPQGPPRVPGARAVRPRPAATLIIVRRDGPKPRVLMGKRNAGHGFMPNLWVFPGGRIDRSDYRAPAATELRGEVAATFDRRLRPGLGRALALAAVRETFEEAGLLLARPVAPRPSVGPWRDFLAQGAAADLDAIGIVARAITPPQVGRRFDTWFLSADAERLTSLERQPDCGELEDIAWLEFDETRDMPLPAVTRFMIGEAAARLEDPGRAPLFLRRGPGGRTTEHL